ncbi:MAG: isochorismatase family cysteine hydrolase [Hyphomicrobiales bacterium]
MIDNVLNNADKDTMRPDRWDRWHAADGRTSLIRRSRPTKSILLDANPGAIEVDLASSALLIVDMQNDFLEQEGWFAKDREQDVEPLKSVLDSINTLSATFREHQAPVIHLNWGVRADTANLPANTLDKANACGTQIGYGDKSQNGRVLVDGDWGSRSIDAIDVANTDFQVSKHRLSGFRDNELDQMLRRLGVTTLFFTGVNIDRCVFATLMDGCFQGYDAILVEDACQTTSPTYVRDAILYLVRLLYGFTVEATHILEAVNGQLPTLQTYKGNTK